MTKTLIATAISAVLATPMLAIGDDDATTWPDKAKPTEQSSQSKQQKQRTTPRADQAMSGQSAAAGGSARPSYDPPLPPSAAKPQPGPDASTYAPPHSPAYGPSQSSVEQTAEPGPYQRAKPTGE